MKHTHYDPVLVETSSGTFGWFMNGKITGELSRKDAESKYPRGVQTADLKLSEGCVYCAHCGRSEAVKPRVSSDQLVGYFGEQVRD